MDYGFIMTFIMRTEGFGQTDGRPESGTLKGRKCSQYAKISLSLY